MGTAFGSFNSSPLGAFVRSPLGVRGGVSIGLATLIVLDNDGNVYGLDPATLTVLFGPLDLPGVQSTHALEFMANGPTFFVRAGSGQTAFDVEGEVLWSIDGGAGTNTEYLDHIALLNDNLYRFVEETAETILLQARDALTGALVDSVEFGEVAPAAGGIHYDNFPIGLVREGGVLFVLTRNDVAAGAGSSHDYYLRRVNPLTLAITDSLFLGTHEIDGERPISLGRGPNLLHVGWNISGDEDFATSYNLDFEAVLEVDYNEPYVGRLQSDATPVVFHSRLPAPVDKMTRRTFAGVETHASVALESIVMAYLLRTDIAVVEIEEVDDHPHTETGVGYEQQLYLTQRWQETTWSLPEAPSGMFISSDGLITWATPTAGAHTLTARAVTASGEDEESWQITVSVEGDPTTEAPVLIPIADHGHDSSSGLYFVVADTSQGDGTLVWSFVSGNPSGMVIEPLGTGAFIIWEMPAVGVYTITYKVENSLGFDTDTYELTVT